MEDLALITSILAGLPQRYDTMVTVLSHSSEKLTVESVESHLLLEEPKHTKASTTKESTAFSAHQGRAQQPASHGPSRPSRNQNVECYYCHKKGHIQAECRKKKREDAAKSTQSCQSQQPFVLSASKTSGFGVDDWILDSGAEQHICLDRTLFDSVTTVSNTFITFGNGHNEPVQGVGNVSLECVVNGKASIVQLRDVAYVPTAFANLVSVRKADKSGIITYFAGGKCAITFQGSVVLTGAARGDVYVVHRSHKSSLPSAVSMSAVRTEDPQQWYRRYAHLGWDNMLHWWSVT